MHKVNIFLSLTGKKNLNFLFFTYFNLYFFSSNNQREVDVEAYNSFPGSLLPPVPSSDNLERPQNNSNPWSQVRQDAVPGRGSRLPNLHQDAQRVNDQGGIFIN